MADEVIVESLDENKTPVNPDVKKEPVDDHDKTDPEIIALRRRIKEEADKRRALEDKLREEEENKLKEKEEFKALYEKTKSEVAGYKIKAEELDRYEKMERERILTLIPEDKREKYSNLGLQALKVVEEDFLNKEKPIFKVDSNAPAVNDSGYETLMDAAKAFKSGDIDNKAYAKIRRYFTGR